MSGGGGTTNSKVTQSNLPEYARPYYEGLMQRGEAESQQPYTPYQGQRLAGQSDATQAGLGAIANYANTSPGLLNQAANTQSQVANAALGMGGYQANGVTNTYTGPAQGNYQGSNYNSQQMGFGQNGLNQIDTNLTADQISTGTFGSEAAQQYMSPYMDAVVNRAQENAARNYQIEESQRRLNQAKAGSFGGSRAAVQSQMAANALQNNLTDIMVQGQQSAYENAQNQFNADQGRSLTAAQANQQANLTAQNSALEAARANQQAALTFGQANQNAALDATKMNEQSRQFGYGATEGAYRNAAQLGMTAQQQSEQLRQSGANLGLQGLDLANNAAKGLTDMQGAYDTRALQQAQALLGVGQTREDYQQQQLDQSYNDFVNQRDSERQNLQFLSSLLQGVPVSANQDVQSTQGQNNITGALGSLGGLQALYALGKT